MHNEFEKNKRIFLTPYNSSAIPLPPADKSTTGGKGPGQDGWESLDGVAEGPVQATIDIGTMVKCKTPGSSTEQIGRVIGKEADNSGYYKIELEPANKDGKRLSWLFKRSEFEPIHVHVETAANDMANEGPIHRTKRDIARAEKLRLVPRWPDSGVAMPMPKKPDFAAVLARGLHAVSQATDDVIEDVKNIVFPRDVGEDGVVHDKKIHQFGLNENIDEALERTSIDNDDMNDWAGLANNSEFAEAMLALNEYEDNVDHDDIGSSVESEDDRPYPTEDDYRSEGFYNNLFVSKTKVFKWVLPGSLAIGPHPIFTSHLEDLSELKRAGFKAIVSLFDKPLDEKYLDGFQYLFVPTSEGSSSDLQRVCKFIANQEALGNSVFMHSLHGKGRVGTALAAYFMHMKYLVGAEEAMNYIKQNYGDDAIETTYQEDALLKFMLDE